MDKVYKPLINLYEKWDTIFRASGKTKPLPPPPPNPYDRIKGNDQNRPEATKKDTVDVKIISTQYTNMLKSYQAIVPNRGNEKELRSLHKNIIVFQNKWANVFEENESLYAHFIPMNPTDRMLVYYRQHPDTVNRDTTLLNIVAKRYNESLQEYLKISPVSDGNLRYVYKRLTIYYNNWSKIFEETEGVEKLTPLPTIPEERIAAYKKQ